MLALTSQDEAAMSRFQQNLKGSIDKLDRAAYHYRDEVKKIEDAEELVTRFSELWGKGAAFFVTGVVTAPYDGCFYEPNIWLVTPPGSKEHFNLNRMWSPCYKDVKGRRAALKEIADRSSGMHTALWHFKWELETKIRKTEQLDKMIQGAILDEDFAVALRERVLPATRSKVVIEFCQTYLAIYECNLEVEEQFQSEIKALEEKYPPLPEPEDSVVFPLYGSGQGEQVDTLRSFEDCLHWLAFGRLPQFEEGDQTYKKSRLGGSCISSGTFDSFEVYPWGPVSQMNPDEHYWTAAVRIAANKWELDIPWICGKCDSEVCGVEESQSPHNTGYRGNGGIGVFMSGSLCDQCFDEGTCPMCRNHSGEDHDIYDDAVAGGTHFCEWHSKELLKHVILPKETQEKVEALSRDSFVILQPKLANPEQYFSPGVEPIAKKSWELVHHLPKTSDEAGNSIWPKAVLGPVSVDEDSIMKLLESEDVESCICLETRQVEENGEVRLETQWAGGPGFLSQWIEECVKAADRK